ncbi:PucR family transcriptional regulator [Actinocrispum wychmicini]|uniref:PucR-like helix-turn-helix protein n=1 Tax=Actinocrispum wychmicini TaxID=1213861 RepID=A0A4R2JY30_9PSEU|nr:helix-turn-helix domain-containing protein [Actinocrispum wychmicini]TCO62139.1 PucR-like helix-turn-helix protein [Actinocrispum wychmicini]
MTLPAIRPDAPLMRRLPPRIRELAARTMATCQAELPLYALLPQEEIDGEMADIVVKNIRVYLDSIRAGRTPTESELATIMSSAMRRAEERIPLADVLAAYHIGARVCWQAMIQLAGPDDTDDLLAAGTYMMTHMQAVTAAISTAFLEVQQTIYGEEREARRALCAALLAGQPAEELADKAGVPIAPAYLVLAIEVLVPQTGDSTTTAGAAVAARRRIRRTQGELDAFAQAPVIGTIDGGTGIALLPAATASLDTMRTGLPDLVARLTDALDAPTVAAVCEATTPARLPEAADQAREITQLVRALHYPPGLYHLDDVLLEYQLTRPSPARDRLAARLAELAEHPHLLNALRAHALHGNNRQAAAAELHVHPNTFDYRLRRAATITGLDPARPDHARVIAAALTVLDHA